MAARHTDCIITFQKQNGDIIMRPRLGICGLENIQIGDETSMGWKVIDIHFMFYDGNYYHEKDYKRLTKEYYLKKEPISKRFKRNVANYLAKKTYAWRQF